MSPFAGTGCGSPACTAHASTCGRRTAVRPDREPMQAILSGRVRSLWTDKYNRALLPVSA